MPVIEPKTWGDLPPLVVELQSSLIACNRDKMALRQWAEAQDVIK